MHSDQSPSRSDDIDLVTLGRAVWRAKGWIVGLAILAGIITFVILSMMRPVYTSEARILIENVESTYRRPAADQSAPSAPALDEQAIQSQVQVLTSRDLILKVVEELDLANDPAFAADSGEGLIGRIKRQLGLTSEKSQSEAAAGVFAEHLTVYQIGKSSVIAVDYTSGDPDLAAKAANSLSRVYIEWQREAKLAQTRDATAWLRSQIDALRDRVSESEAAVENFRANEGIFAGSNNVDLTAQQLSELNSKLILAKAQKSEAEARARMIRQMLADNGDIEATSEVLKSALINALIEQRVQVQRQLAELSATLLPSHPRIQQLYSELDDVQRQIRDEARKIAQSLENEAEVADARVQSLTASLKAAKTEASGEGEAEIKLRALEREAKSNRDLLESYLARYQDASARGDVGAVPANATLVSQAYPSTTPSFPKKLPITLLVMLAVALVGLAYVVARELIRATTASAAQQPVAAGRTGREVQVVDAGLPVPDEDTRNKTPAVYRPEPELSDSNRSDTQTTESDPEPQIRSVQEVLSRFRRPDTAESVNSHSPGRRASDKSRELTAVPDREESESLPIPSPKSPTFPIAIGTTDDETAKPSAEPETHNAADESMESASAKAEAGDVADMSPLARYLRERTVQKPASRQERRSRPDASQSKATKDVVRDFDALKDRFAEQLDRQASPVALITPISAANALPEAIQLARPLAQGGKTVLLLDMAQGATTVSDFLGLKRSPGFNELLANAAAFEDVLHVDRESPLQVIPAGNPDLTAPPSEVKSFVRILDALRQTYDCVVIHSDFPRAKHFAEALNGELATAVALFAPDTLGDEAAGLDQLNALDCPFIVYERAEAAADSRSDSLRKRLAAS